MHNINVAMAAKFIQIEAQRLGRALGLGEARQLIADNCKQWSETKAKEYATDAWMDHGGK
jgi:hypothetical protein